ncbi:MAG: hypothetical protein ABII07_05305 [Patescibacteria group bacterium]|nr:hypothetical protein [Patescibacteria group bacterium]
MPYIATIILAILLIIFLVYAGLAVNHAKKFRYISKRTLYLTYFFVASSSALIFSILIAAILVDWHII